MRILKKIFMLTLIITILFNYANAHEVNIKVNNEYVTSDVAPFILNSTTYVPIRLMSNILKTNDISWNNDTRTVTIKNGSDKILLIVNQKYAYVNNVYTNLGNAVLLIDGRTFVPLRFVAENFDANVTWDQATNTVSILTTNKSSATSRGSRPSSTGTTNYSDNVYWLSRIIEAEAAGEPFIGKVAVGEVILSRVKSEDFPNTIWEVIFDTNFGVQFTPVANGTIYNTPSGESIKAAETALSGSNYVGDSLYFLNPAEAQSTWIIKNREFCVSIANHDFYR